MTIPGWNSDDPAWHLISRDLSQSPPCNPANTTWSCQCRHCTAGSSGCPSRSTAWPHTGRGLGARHRGKGSGSAAPRPSLGNRHREITLGVLLPLDPARVTGAGRCAGLVGQIAARVVRIPQAVIGAPRTGARALPPKRPGPGKQEREPEDEHGRHREPTRRTQRFRPETGKNPDLLESKHVESSN